MKNKRLIKLVISLFTISALIGVTIYQCFNSNLFVKAISSSSGTPYKTIDVGYSDSMTSDTDIYGNQIYVWLGDGAMYYQRFNAAGEPISSQNNISNIGDAHNPDVAFTDTGFAVVWQSYNGLSGNQEIRLSTFSHTDAPITTGHVVSDELIGYDAKPKIAGNSYSNEIGVTWEKCEDIYCESHDIAFRVLDMAGTEYNAGDITVNTRLQDDQSFPDISLSSGVYMITWHEYDSNLERSLISARGFFEQGEKNTDVITVSTTQNQLAYKPSIDSTYTQDYLGTSDDGVSPDDLLNEFFIAWTQTAPTGTDIYVRKINCIINNISDRDNPGDYIDVLECTADQRGGEANIIRANTTTGYNSIAAISAYKPYNPIQRNRPYQDTALDMVNVSWAFQINSSYNIVSQNFTNNLERSGGEITVSTNLNAATPIHSSSNQDGFFTISYGEGEFGKAAYIPSQYLRKGDQRGINAPDTRTQDHSKVSVANNGNYAIVYEQDNGIDQDIFLALYDSNGSPIKNNQIATTTTTGDQTNPQVGFFNELSDSENSGKFIVSWEGEGNGDSSGIFYQYFDSNGEKIGTENLANNNTSDIQSNNVLKVGKYNQFGILYAEGAIAPSNVKLFYNNNSNQIISTISSDLETVNLNFALSPEADGSFGTNGKTKMAITYDKNGAGEGFLGAYLEDANTINLGSIGTINATISDIDGGYKEALNSLSSPADPFFIVVNSIDQNLDVTNNVYAFTTNGTNTILASSIGQINSKLAVDNYTGNFISYYSDPGNIIYEARRNTSQAILLTEGSNTNLFRGQHIYKNDYTTNAYVDTISPNSATLTSSSGNFYNGDQVGELNTYSGVNSIPSLRLNFTNDISSNFTVEQTVTGQNSGATGTVVGISNYFIILEDITGTFIDGEGVDNIENDIIESQLETLNIYFDSFEGYNFSAGDTAINGDRSVFAEVQYSHGDYITIEGQTFFTTPPSGDVLKFNILGTVQSDVIGTIQANINTLSIETNGTLAIKLFGPNFSTNQYKIYGQSLINPSIDYNTTSSLEDEKIFVSTFSTNNFPNELQLDGNGVYQQIFSDPFTLGTKEDLSPLTSQEITAGGKYIVVPQNINFGTISRSGTGVVNFADLNPACLQVTDLDGTDFDLTASLTNLVNSSVPTEIIPNSNFVIENNDGINPLIQTTYGFTNANDVTIDPSTDPGQEANLSSSKTLLRKTNTNTGSWTICPTVKLTVQSDATSGTYNGILTFTLI